MTLLPRSSGYRVVQAVGEISNRPIVAHFHADSNLPPQLRSPPATSARPPSPDQRMSATGRLLSPRQPRQPTAMQRQQTSHPKMIRSEPRKQAVAKPAERLPPHGIQALPGTPASPPTSNGQ